MKIQRVCPLLSTGSTLLNLALTGDPRGGFVKGKYFFLVGDSTSGKTFLSMTCFAEAVQNPAFDEYRLIYDNVEDGMHMDVPRLFGTSVAERLEAPAQEDGEHVFSETIEEFYYHLDDAISQGRPFLYVLDSMDGLSSAPEQEKFLQQKKAHRAGKSATGTYGDGKAKHNSAGLRKALAGLRDTGSILIIVCQTRDSLGASAWGPRKTRSGGHALRFYATVELWTSVVGQVKRTVRGVPRKIGVRVGLKTTKNRITGQLHEVKTAIYPSYGIDDIGSCIEYLVTEGWWKKSGRGVAAKEFGDTTTPEALAVRCASSAKELRKLRQVVAACWEDVQQKCKISLPARYGG
jgi:RecA/RadA recombinase